MRLLSDTDTFCKLSAIGLFKDAAKLLGGEPAEVARLPALPHMLRRGRGLRKQLGNALADSLAPLADAQPQVPTAPTEVAALLTGKNNIDVGEVQLLALAASDTLLLMSGDKRALLAVCNVSEVVPLLEGKVVCLEAILLALCRTLGVDRVRAAVAPHRNIDKVFQVCFSDGGRPVNCLRSYMRDLQESVKPLVLWSPDGGAP